MSAISKNILRTYFIIVILHPYKTDAPNKQTASSYQFWTNLHAYIISSDALFT